MAIPRGSGMDHQVNPVVEAIDGAVGDWSMSGDAMRWSPELAERGPVAVVPDTLDGLEAAAGLGTALGLDMSGMRRLVSGALTSLGTAASDVVQELRELARGTGPDDA